MYTSFNATLAGLLPIRAYGGQRAVHAHFMGCLEKNATCWWWWLIANRWFGLWLDILCFVLVSACSFFAVALRNNVEPGLLGLALIYILSLSGMFQVTHHTLFPLSQMRQQMPRCSLVLPFCWTFCGTFCGTFSSTCYASRRSRRLS